MGFYIKGHKTVTSGKNLCESCKFGVSVRGYATREELVYCHKIEKPMQFQVSECNRYEAENTLAKWELERMAWRIGTDKKTKKIGFYTPMDLRTVDQSKVDFGNGNPDDEMM